MTETFSCSLSTAIAPSSVTASPRLPPARNSTMVLPPKTSYSILPLASFGHVSSCRNLLPRRAQRHLSCITSMAVDSVSVRPHDDHSVKDVLLQTSDLTIYSDWSYVRHTVTPTPASSKFENGFASKDVVLDPSTGVWARIFLPERVANESTKIPVVVHFHGGGFCLNSPSDPAYHQFFSRMAVSSRCIWVLVSYRLAPENPLQVAYDDAETALHWLHSQASAQGDASGTEPWLAQHADFSKCFLSGDSSGGTTVHFLCARVTGRDWSPVRLQALLLLNPGFIEFKNENATADNAVLLEFFKRSALPPGAEWGHPWWNPLHPGSPLLSKMNLPPVFMAVSGNDFMKVGGKKYYELLKQAGKEAQLFESPGEGHCFFLNEQDSAATKELETQIIEYIEKYS